MDDRLNKSDWIDHGLRTLAKHGAGALKVVPMAEKLKVSRGSFYWHFADIADFKAQLLAAWRARSTDQVIQEIEGAAEPDRLKHLLRRAFSVRRSLDRAIRSWAAEDKTVASIVAADDSARITYIAGLLSAAGVPREKARRRATFLFWAYLGHAIAMDLRHEAIGVAAMDDISALFEK